VIPANPLMRTRLDRYRFLARTPGGAWQVNAPSDDLPPTLRAMLLMASGRVTVGEILDRAGNMSNIVEGQITTLLEMGLVELARTRDVEPDAGGAAPEERLELQPVARAKIDLLKELEASGSCDATLLADDLLDARTLRELALRAREIAYRLRDADGNAVAEAFWTQAKKILLARRDLSASAAR
jgi:DNA-binding transcriptional ArsR family regulator